MINITLQTINTGLGATNKVLKGKAQSSNLRNSIAYLSAWLQNSTVLVVASKFYMKLRYSMKCSDSRVVLPEIH